ncbi:hypothetical protein POX_c04715 [Penicillium oxalicum]|nr:hypothetical protein POX_c04715 [Penicillium oxalicum]KAI2791836.1 hypothetical protein POX_c04715 [Penicillium oxalicum]
MCSGRQSRYHTRSLGLPEDYASARGEFVAEE